MVENLQLALQKAIQRYIIPDESDDEISIEYNAGHHRKRPRFTSRLNNEESHVAASTSEEYQEKAIEVFFF